MRRFALLVLVTVSLPAGDAAQSAAAKKELARLQGRWRLIAREIEGKKATPNAVKKADATLTVKGDRITYKSQGEELWQATLKLDPTKSPPVIEATHISGPLKGKTGKAIYKLEADRLTVCFSYTELPTDFTTEDTDRALVVYRREKQ
jgi:uncharacterized protein (TIGR03067 family)